jgi:hypothetical protein
LSASVSPYRLFQVLWYHDFMRHSIARVKGLGFLAWHARHEFYHALLGLVWAWILREWWGEFNPRWILLSVFGSLLPDADHLLYFGTYGRSSDYTSKVRHLLKTRQWRNLMVFIENGHKFNTNLSYHNYYFMAVLLGMAFLSSFWDWQAGIILFGAMLIHYIFDIVDDLIQLGAVNPNWKRWGRDKTPSDNL